MVRSNAFLLAVLTILSFASVARAQQPQTPAPTSSTVTTINATTAPPYQYRGVGAFTWGLIANGQLNPAIGGQGYSVGNIITLNDGCAVHVKLIVTSVTNYYNNGILNTAQMLAGNQGQCSAPPSGVLSQLSVSPAGGGGAQWVLNWGPYPASVNNNLLPGPALAAASQYIATYYSPAGGVP